MLRLWRDLYRIVLHPNQVTLVRVQKGRLSRTKEMSRLLDITESTSPSWLGALEHLDALIADIRSAKADVEVVLSNHFVRYAVVPWSNESMDSVEEQAMTRICFEQTFGDLADGWDMRLSEAGYGQSRLASAVDRELTQALSDVFAKTALRLISIQPYLMASINHLQRQVQDEDFLFLMGERGRLCFAQVRSRQWSQVRSSPVDDIGAELPALLSREILLSGLKPGIKKYFFSPDGAEKGFSLPDVQVLSLAEISPDLRSGLSFRSPMYSLQLDYRPKHWFAYKAGAMMFIAAVLAGVYVMGRYALTSSEVKSQESQWQDSQRGGHASTGDAKVTPERLARLKPELKRANEVVQQLALPWDGLFKAIEVFDPNQVALLRIETDISRHEVTITAESKNFNAMLGYVRGLNKQSTLTDVYLISHQIQEHDAQRPIRFTVSVVWSGDKS